jgi:hypothetical protein
VSAEPGSKHSDLVYIATRSDSRGKLTLARVSSDGQIKLLDSAETGLNDPCYMQFVPDGSGLVISHVGDRGLLLPSPPPLRYLLSSSSSAAGSPSCQSTLMGASESTSQTTSFCPSTSPSGILGSMALIPTRCVLPYNPLRSQSSLIKKVIIHDDEIIVPDQGCNVVYRLRYDARFGFTLLDTLTDFLEAEAWRCTP